VIRHARHTERSQGAAGAAVAGVALALGATLACPTSARASRLHGTELTNLDLNLDLLTGADFERYRRVAPGENSAFTQKLVFGQRVGGYAAGNIIHERLWAWKALANLLVIEDLQSGDLVPVQSTMTPLPLYESDRVDVQGEWLLQSDFLQHNTFPTRIWTSRDVTIYRRRFGSNFWMSRLVAGATHRWRNKVFPIGLSYVFTRNDGDPVEVQTGAQTHEASFTGHLNPVEGQGLDTLYRFIDYDNRFFHAYRYRFHIAQALHKLPLNTLKTWRLESRLRFHDRAIGADLDRQQRALDVEERLVWTPTRTVRGRLAYDLGWQRFAVGGDPANDTLRNDLWLDLRHQLWQSLTSRGRAYGRYEVLTGGYALEGGGSAGVRYRKRLGDHLVMAHGYTFRGQARSTYLNRDEVTVTDWRVTLDGDLPVALPNRRILADTLEVLSSDGLTRYVQGRDFAVDAQGDYLFLRRLPTGDIPTGATVLVSYRYSTGGEAQTSTRSHLYEASVATNGWKFWGMEARYRLFDDTTEADGATLPRTTYHTLTASLWTQVAEVRGDAGYEFTSSQLFEGHGVWGGARYDIRLSPSLVPTVGFEDRYYDVRFRDGAGYERNILKLYTEGDVPLYGALRAVWSLDYQWHKGEPLDGHYLYARAKLDWRMKRFSVWLGYEARLQLTETAEHERHSVTFNIRRLL